MSRNSLSRRLQALSKSISINANDIQGLDAYTKGEIDALLSGLDVYSTTEVDQLLNALSFYTEAEVDALIAGVSGGPSLHFFQVRDDGTTGQATTGTLSDLVGVWATPDEVGTMFSWDSSTGELEVTSESDVLDFSISVHTYNNLNNRHELHVALLEDSGGGYSAIQEASNYASRSNTQDEGQVVIASFKVFSVSAGTKYKIAVSDIGVSATVGAPQVAGQTYLSVTGVDNG